ncbi:MAG: hypothetical protein A2231_00890 [Candidatus Firestonebacteria bacterium RIFOXYA2_FULL_40_8]|nr:MAG: hypothetical protein A2231_00890 [Candidatus Firestonebacteria bacterium RIFOXYA2_FULL_40_8]
MKVVGEIGANNIKVTVFGRTRGIEEFTLLLGNEEVLSKEKSFFEVLAVKGLETAVISAISLILPFGPEKAKNPELMKEKIIGELEELSDVYPSYIPFAVKFLKKLLKENKKIPVSLYFDTSFFQKLPPEELYYALPKSSSKKSKLKKLGYHGIYHSYAAEQSGRNKKVISVVLDKKTTVCGIENNLPVTVSLGSTPLEGIMSLTSCGDLDPGAVFYIMKKTGYSIYKMDELLKKESGFFGVTDYRVQVKDLAEMYGNDEKVKLAFDIYRNQILKYLGGSLAVLSGVDTIVFSGVEVNSLEGMVYELLKQINFLGIHLKESPWEKDKAFSEISLPDSKVKVFINHKKTTEIVNEKMKAK